MATLTDLGRRFTPLTEPDIDWLHALVSDWQLLADLSFADLVLWAALRDGSGWLALAQMRPTTGPTTFLDDVVGTRAGPHRPGAPGGWPWANLGPGVRALGAVREHVQRQRQWEGSDCDRLSRVRRR